MENALTPEEWAEGMVRGDSGAWDKCAADVPPNTIHAQDHFTGKRRHALAALALRNQRCGFTRDDVASLRDLADLEAQQQEYHSAEQIAHWRDLADRIEALLPPA